MVAEFRSGGPTDDDEAGIEKQAALIVGVSEAKQDAGNNIDQQADEGRDQGDVPRDPMQCPDCLAELLALRLSLRCLPLARKSVRKAGR